MKAFYMNIQTCKVLMTEDLNCQMIGQILITRVFMVPWKGEAKLAQNQSDVRPEVQLSMI